MLHTAIARARTMGGAELIAELVPTPRNPPCLEFFRRSGLRPDGDRRFVWNVNEAYPCPPFVALHDQSAVSTTGNA